MTHRALGRAREAVRHGANANMGVWEMHGLLGIFENFGCSDRLPGTNIPQAAAAKFFENGRADVQFQKSLVHQGSPANVTPCAPVRFRSDPASTAMPRPRPPQADPPNVRLRVTSAPTRPCPASIHPLGSTPSWSCRWPLACQTIMIKVGFFWGISNPCPLSNHSSIRVCFPLGKLRPQRKEYIYAYSHIVS